MNSFFNSEDNVQTPLQGHIADLARKSIDLRMTNLFWQLFTEAIHEPENPGEDISYIDQVTTSDNTVVLVTGGLDSTIAYHRALQESDGDVIGLYIDFGQPYAQREQDILNNLGIPFRYTSIDIGYDSENSDWKHIIPARNFLALDAAAYIAGRNGTVWFGVTHGESPARGGDKSQFFLHGTSLLFSQLYGTKEIKTLLDGTKTNNIKKFLEEGGNPEIILNTYSCFNGTHKHCGHCQSCLRHYIALFNNGFSHETIMEKYEMNPLENCGEYIEKYRRKMGHEIMGYTSKHYGFRRCEETLRVIGQDILQEFYVTRA